MLNNCTLPKRLFSTLVFILGLFNWKRKTRTATAPPLFAPSDAMSQPWGLETETYAIRMFLFPNLMSDLWAPGYLSVIYTDVDCNPSCPGIHVDNSSQVSHV